MGNQLAEVKGHLVARIAHADFAAVPGALQREVKAATLPHIAQLIQRDRNRAKRRGGLALEKPQALGQLIGNQMAQRHSVGQHDKAYAFQCLVWAGTHGHVGGDNGDLGFKINTKGFAGHHHVVAGADEVVTAALVHQGVGVESGGQFGDFGVACLASQLNVVDKSRAVGPLVSAWQWCHALGCSKRKGMTRLAVVQRFIQVLQLWRHEVPVVQNLLQFAGDASCIMRARQIA